MQQRWLNKLLGYDFVVQYKKDLKNRMVDALSRVGEEEMFSLSLLSVPTLEWVEKIKGKGGQDPKLLLLHEKCLQGSLNSHYSV